MSRSLSYSKQVFSLLGLALSCGAASSFATAATLVVPTQYPTIQAALDATVDGDIVEVLPGLYTGPGNLDLTFDADVELRSTDGPASTVIDAGSDLLDRHLHASFGSGSASPVIDGFALRGGTGGVLELGGSLFITAGSPVFRNCVFEENFVRASGGAVFASGATVSFQDCEFLSNRAENEGGAVRVEQGAVVTFEECRFAGNESTVGRGGAVVSRGSSSTFEACLLTGNLASSKGGGALLVDGGTAEFRRSILAGNRAGDTPSDFGGAILIEGGADVTFTRSVVYGNEAFADFDEAAVMSGSSASFDCCVLGLDEIGGAGSVELTDATDDVPLFCDGRSPVEAPTTEGAYTVEEGSPCLPPNSPCGLTIGPFDEGGCAVSTVESPDLYKTAIVFPNPTRGHFSIQSEATIRDLRVFDAMGREVEVVPVSNSTSQDAEYRLKNVQTRGVYFLRMRTEAGSTTTRIQVLK